jgi:hypothetical protein
MLDRVVADVEDDGDRRRCRFGRQRRSRTSGCDDHGDLSANQFSRQRRQSIELIFGPAMFNRYVFALVKAGLFQAWRKARSRSVIVSGDAAWRNPTTGIAGCCARAASGHAAVPQSSVMNSRRLN